MNQIEAGDSMSRDTILKRDSFGIVTVSSCVAGGIVTRDTLRAAWWARPLARHLARREARALQALSHLEGVPRLIDFDGSRLRRTFLAGEPMHEARPGSRQYFRDAFKLLCRLHRSGLVHNDLAKEPNWLQLAGGGPGIVDFQLAWAPKRRNALFRALAREDLRHLLKHKRTYLPDGLTGRQKTLLATPTGLARAWAFLVKPPYLFVTRRVLGWPEREGPAERER